MSKAKQQASDLIDSTPRQSLYTCREDIAVSFQPATPYENMLVSQAALSYQRLLRAQDVERRLFEETDPLQMLKDDLPRFRVVQRMIADAERAWSRAIQQLKAAQRDRAAQVRHERFNPRMRLRHASPKPIAVAATTPLQPNPPEAAGTPESPQGA